MITLQVAALVSYLFLAASLGGLLAVSWFRARLPALLVPVKRLERTRVLGEVAADMGSVVRTHAPHCFDCERLLKEQLECVYRALPKPSEG